MAGHSIETFNVGYQQGSDIMTTTNNPNNNLSPWKSGQSGNPSGRPKGTRDLAGYVLETTDGGKELVDALVCIARGVMPTVTVQEGSRPRKDQQGCGQPTS